MARPLDQRRRAELLDGVVRFLSERGLAALSLRPLAAELGTSSRMLIYYFGTKEELLVQALATQHPDLGAPFADVTDFDALRDRLTGLWKSTAIGESAVSARILLQVMGVAYVQPGVFADYAKEAIDRLVDAVAGAMVRCGHTPDDAASDATVAVSGLRGILLDRLVTGDMDRTDHAAARLIERITAPDRRPAPYLRADR